MNSSLISNKFKEFILTLKIHIHWLFLIFLMELLMLGVLWIGNVEILFSVIGLVILGSILTFFAICLVIFKVESKRNKALLNFLDNPSKVNEKELLQAYKNYKFNLINKIVNSINLYNVQIANTEARLENYENYVELWAHEIKVPLSLLSLIIDNNRDEFSSENLYKLEYISNKIQEDISKMLFYYKIKSNKKDYLFEDINLSNIVRNVLFDYKPLLEEKKINVIIDNIEVDVFTDRRGIEFIVSQIISNSIKYSNSNSKLIVRGNGTSDKFTLTIKDEGMGIKSCDIPYVFESGFTGNSEELRGKSTGMGLYLVKKTAADLNVDVKINSKWGEGTEIILYFNVFADNNML